MRTEIRADLGHTSRLNLSAIHLGYVSRLQAMLAKDRESASRKPVRATDGPSVKIAALPAGANACTPSDGMLKLRVLQRGAKRSTDVAHVHVPQDDPLAKTVLQADAVAMVERQRLKQQILSTATSDYRP